jgi:hypothetical protein
MLPRRAEAHLIINCITLPHARVTSTRHCGAGSPSQNIFGA